MIDTGGPAVGSPIDPRGSVIERRLAGIGRILVFGSGKGGVGKTACATVSALLLARRGLRVGLADLDFQGAAAHLFLGCLPGFPEEEGGILPPEVSPGLTLLTIASFTGNRAAPMRGADLSNALIELFCVTIWGRLDVLILDMPPGIGDQWMDLLRFVRRSECVILTRPSVVDAGVAGRLLSVLREAGMTVAGVIENMVRERDQGRAALDGRLLARIPFCADLEDRIGRPQALLESDVAAALAGALDALTPPIAMSRP